MRKPKLIVLTAAAICVLAAPFAFGQGGNPPASTKKSGQTSGRGMTAVEQTVQDSNADTAAAITKLENEAVKADLANDKSFLQNNTTSDFVGGLSLGIWEDKAAMLKGMDDPAKNKTNSESISDLTVTSYGNVAIARYTETYDSIREGKPLARTVLCTDTWVKQGSTWKEAASHCSQKAQQ